MSTTIDLFSDAPPPVVKRPMGESAGDVVARDAPGESAAAVPSPAATDIEYPAAREGETAGDVEDVGARVHPSEALSGAQSMGTTLPAAGGYVSSAEQAAGEPSGSSEATATRAPLARAAGCCGGCGEWTKHLSGMGYCSHLPKWTTMSYRAECHFGPSRWTPLNEEVLAKREAQARIDSAADAADQDVHGWSDSALEFVKSFAASNAGKQFIAQEIIKAALLSDLPRPNDPQAWGRPIQQAARRRLIKRAGVDANRVPIWEAA